MSNAATYEAELQALRAELSIAKQRMRDLEAENSVLAQRAALAVTQEADALQPVFAAKAETQPCYRCGHSPDKPDPNCPCCVDDHTPDQDGHFTLMSAEEFAKTRETP